MRLHIVELSATGFLYTKHRIFTAFRPKSWLTSYHLKRNVAEIRWTKLCGWIYPEFTPSGRLKFVEIGQSDWLRQRVLREIVGGLKPLNLMRKCNGTWIIGKERKHRTVPWPVFLYFAEQKIKAKQFPFSHKRSKVTKLQVLNTFFSLILTNNDLFLFCEKRYRITSKPNYLYKTCIWRKS